MKQITCPHCGDTYPDFDVAHVCSKGTYAPKLKSKMNERIKEIAKEAGYYLYDLTETHECKTVETDSTDEWITLEKFAELIVKECALIAGLMEHEGRKNIGAQILDNFGVDQ